VGVQVDQAAEPAAAGPDADKDEQRAGRQNAPFARPAVRHGHRLQRVVAEQFPHLGDEHDPHVRDPLELVDEVPRYVLAQVVLAHDEGDLGRVPGQEDRRLAGRVAAADDGHRVAGAEQRLCLRGRVVDAHLLEVVQLRHVQPAVPGPGGDDHRGGRHGGSVGQPDQVLAAVLLDRRGLRGHHELGTELTGLEHGPLGELGP
jgi:hypothetical protein